MLLTDSIMQDRTSETSVEKRFVRAAKGDGWRVRKAIWDGHAGAPDRVLFKGGVCVFVELKTSDGVLSPLQHKEHAELRKAGLSVFVVWRIDQIAPVIEEMRWLVQAKHHE